MCIRDSHKERTEHPWLRHVEPQQESGRAGTDPPFYQCSLWPDNGFRCVYLSLAARSGRSHQVWRGTLASEEVQDSGYAVLAVERQLAGVQLVIGGLFQEAQGLVLLYEEILRRHPAGCPLRTFGQCRERYRRE